MPNGAAQIALMKSVYKENGLDPALAGYVEAHGTGTKVGDPIEAAALHEVFCEEDRKKPLFIGSVKTNIGHLEGASGLVSLIKSAMMLEKGFVLPNCDFKKGNAKIPFEDWKLKVNQDVQLSDSSQHFNISRCLLHNDLGLWARSTPVLIILALVVPMRTPFSKRLRHCPGHSFQGRTRLWQPALQQQQADYMCCLPMIRTRCSSRWKI
jgi:hypothetical protein